MSMDYIQWWIRKRVIVLKTRLKVKRMFSDIWVWYLRHPSNVKTGQLSLRAQVLPNHQVFKKYQTSKNQVPNQRVPNQRVPNRRVPNRRIPNRRVPNRRVPNRRVPNQRVPNQRVPKNRVQKQLKRHLP